MNVLRSSVRRRLAQRGRRSLARLVVLVVALAVALVVAPRRGGDRCPRGAGRP